MYGIPNGWYFNSTKIHIKVLKIVQKYPYFGSGGKSIVVKVVVCFFLGSTGKHRPGPRVRFVNDHVEQRYINVKDPKRIVNFCILHNKSV